MDMVGYVISEHDFIKGELKQVLSSDIVRNLEIIPVPFYYKVSYLTDYYDGSIFWDRLHTSVFDKKFGGEGKILFRKHLNYYKPDAIDIWLSADEQNLIILYTETDYGECVGNYKAAHNYFESTATISRKTILLSNEELEKIVQKCKNLKKNKDHKFCDILNV